MRDKETNGIGIEEVAIYMMEHQDVDYEQAIKELERIKAMRTIIIVEEGMIQKIIQEDPDQEVVVLDLDTEGDTEHPYLTEVAVWPGENHSACFGYIQSKNERSSLDDRDVESIEKTIAKHFEELDEEDHR